MSKCPDNRESDDAPPQANSRSGRRQQVDYPVDDLVSEFLDTVNSSETVETPDDISSVLEMLQASYDLEDLGFEQDD